MWQINRQGLAADPPPEQVADETDVARNGRYSSTNLGLKIELHRRLLELINLPALEGMSRAQIETEVGEIVHEQLALQKHALNQSERKVLVSDILDELLGLGPLEPLLQDESINDILVNGHNIVFVERNGRLERTDSRFKDDRHLLRIIQKIVSAVGRRVDEQSPFVDARLADGSRINAVIPPLAIDGPLLSIRKFSKKPIGMARLVELNSVPQALAEVLEAIVIARRNVLISGGTGAGKTTLLNAMSAYIDHDERIVTIEDSAELQLQQSHVVRMETRPPNIEGRGEITQRDLVKNALRMRPDRIIVGEVRAGEAFDMLQAMNTGHDGSMTTIHANTARDALARMENMLSMGQVNMPSKIARAQIASAINVVIQSNRLTDGRRKLTSVAEITGMEGDVITMQEIFVFRQTGVDGDGLVKGYFQATGVRPRFVERLKARGIVLPESLFDPGRRVE
jgi:pilus assembly protein CpaF